MPTVVRGNTITLDALFQLDGSGVLVDADNVKVDIFDPSDIQVVVNDDPTSHPSTGTYLYNYDVAANADLGNWRIHWTGEYEGVPLETTEIFVVISGVSITLPGDETTIPCTPWCEVEDIERCTDISEIDIYVLDDAMWAASEILFNLSKRRWPGLCTSTIRPCSGYESSTWWESYLDWNGEYAYWGGFCSCNQGPECGCHRLSELRIGRSPIQYVQQIKQDGVVLDPTLYRVDNKSRIIRLPDSEGRNPGWPCCQRLDLPSTEEDTLEVTVVYGRTPPVGGRRAAAILAGQFARACSGLKCQFPERVTSVTRQGLSMIVADPFLFFEKGRTGIYQVDLWLSSVNRRGYTGSARIITPDIGPRGRRVDT